VAQADDAGTDAPLSVGRSGDAAGRRPNGGSARGTSAPPARGTSAPPGRGTSAPPGRGTSAPPGRGTSAPPGRGTSAPPGRGTSAPPGRGTSAPPARHPRAAGRVCRSPQRRLRLSAAGGGRSSSRRRFGCPRHTLVWRAAGDRHPDVGSGCPRAHLARRPRALVIPTASMLPGTTGRGMRDAVAHDGRPARPARFRVSATPVVPRWTGRSRGAGPMPASDCRARLQSRPAPRPRAASPRC
jgi:hypothetical protein